jgi:anti-sigma28 factor (negative regulator of flagellin synthesis)
MRIDDLNRIPVAPNAEKSEQTAQQHSPGKEPVANPDQAEVSDLAQALAKPDSGRIDQLRLQVQSGTYDVSAQIVAQSMITAHIKD